MRNWTLHLIEIVRWDGLSGLVGRISERLGWQRYLWLVRPVDLPPPAVAAMAGVTIREIGPEATAAYVEFRGRAIRAQYEERLRRGQRCFAAETDGQLVAVSWLAVEDADIVALGQTLVLAPGDGYVLDSFVDPAWRGRRVRHLLYSHLLAQARSAGVRRLCCLVAPYNRRIRRSCERSGYRQSAVVTRVGFGRFHLQWWRGEFRGELLAASVRGRAGAIGAEAAGD